MELRKDIIRATDETAIRLAKTLIRTARYGAIGVIEPSGSPLASRVGVASDCEGAPLILISTLAAHTVALLADPRCSLLLGEPGKGDPLAHPRVSLIGRARRLEAGTAERERAQLRYLARNPKAKLYAGLGDFAFFRVEPDRASLNAGFGKAYHLERPDLLCISDAVDGVAAMEQGAVEHMNADHREAVNLYAQHFAGQTGDNWTMTGIDVEGLDLVAGDRTARVFFPTPLTRPGDLRRVLVKMAQTARQAQRLGS